MGGKEGGKGGREGKGRVCVTFFFGGGGMER